MEKNKGCRRAEQEQWGWFTILKRWSEKASLRKRCARKDLKGREWTVQKRGGNDSKGL